MPPILALMHAASGCSSIPQPGLFPAGSPPVSAFMFTSGNRSPAKESPEFPYQAYSQLPVLSVPTGVAVHSEMAIPSLGIHQKVLQPGLVQPVPSPSFQQCVQQSGPVQPSPSPHLNWWVLQSNLAWLVPPSSSHSCLCVLWTEPSWPVPGIGSHMCQQVLYPSLA